jgi:hypothetical protein
MIAVVGSTGGMYGSSTSGAPPRHRAPLRWMVAEPAVPTVLDVPDVPDVEREGSVGLSAGVEMKEIGVLSRPASTGAG